MTRVRYPRVAVGNGSYCYAGPDCKLHGKAANTKTESSDLSTGNSQAQTDGWSRQDFSSKLEACNKAYDEAVKASKFVENLSDLKGNALMKGYLARESNDGTGYHVYKADASLLATGTRVLYQEIASAAADGVLAPKKANDLRKELSEYSNQVLRPQEGANQGAIHNRQQQLASARIRQGLPAVLDKDTVTPALYPVTELSNKQLLEYYQCGRKKSFNSEQEAQYSISVVGDPSLQSYKCSHCDKTHTGHGGGQNSEEEQLLSAARHWVKFPEKSNMFAFSKGLIN
jgi:hypothetical protein